MRDEGVTGAPRCLPRDLGAVEGEAGYRAGPTLSSIPSPRTVFSNTYKDLKQSDSQLITSKEMTHQTLDFSKTTMEAK